MSFGFGIGDIVTIAQCSKLAWDTFSAIKNAPKEFRALESEVQSLAISLKSLDDADTSSSILNYTRGNPLREQNLTEILRNSSNALAPMKSLVEKYRVRDTAERREIRDWLTGAKFTFNTMSIQDFRNKLSLHTASLNIFLTTLTHSSLGRLEKLITDGRLGGSAIGLVNMGAGEGTTDMGKLYSSGNTDDGLNGVWTSIGRDLALSNLDKAAMARDISRFRDDISNYVLFLMGGGRAFSYQELSIRHSIRLQKLSGETIIPVSGRMSTPQSYSYDYVQEGPISPDEEDELRTLLNEMVSFDGEDSPPGDYDGGDGTETWKNPESVARSTPPEILPHSEAVGSHGSNGQTSSLPPSKRSLEPRGSHIRCDTCSRRLLPGEMYLHCKICQSSNDNGDRDGGYDVCDPCWEKGQSCPGKHRDERYFNHRERRIAEMNE